MPLPRQSVISSRACSSTSSGSAAGPAAKLNTRTQPLIWEQALSRARDSSRAMPGASGSSCRAELQRTDFVAAAVADRRAITARATVRVVVTTLAVDRRGVIADLESRHALDAG